MVLSLVTYTTGSTPTTMLDEVERKLYGNQRTQLNRLSGTMSEVTTSMSLGFDLDGVRPGAYVEVDDEVVYVWTVSGADATVQRQMLGTTAAEHLGDTIVRVEPRFMRAEMINEIQKEIRSWPTNIYRRYSGDIGIAAQRNAVSLDGLFDVTGAALLRVQVSPETANEEKWLRVEGARLERRQDITGFPSSYALTVPADYPNPRTLRVLVRAPFSDAVVGPTSDFGSIGMNRDLIDIIPWGVVGRLLMTRDVARTDASAQGRSRPAEEVRGGDAIQVGRAMLEERDRLLREAGNRLVAEDGMGWM